MALPAGVVLLTFRGFIQTPAVTPGGPTAAQRAWGTNTNNQTSSRAFLCLPPEPVSYTHLDVYKRHEYASATMHVSCIHVCAVSVLVVLIDRYVISILKI